jgi:hypothetical protein
MQDAEYGYCQCGCGEKTAIATKTNRAQSQIAGQPNRFLPGHRPKKHPDYLEEDRGYDTPCWIWQGGHDRNGYSWVNRAEHRGCAHVMYYKRAHGPVPPGMELDHLCRVRNCVNPDHLEVLTRAENINRGYSPPAVNKRKTHCKHGHEFTPENTYWLPSRPGQRHCRACQKRLLREYWERRRAKQSADQAL